MSRATVAIVAVTLALTSIAIAMHCLPQERDVITVSYGKNPRQDMDIYPAEGGGDRPVLMFLHGGGWNSGDKSEGAGYAEDILSNGCLPVSVNYRLSVEDGAGIEQMLEDVSMAIAYLKDHAAEYGVDVGRMGIFGFSAGGHISMMYAYTMESPIPIEFVVSYAGPTDLTDPDLYRNYSSSNSGVQWMLDSINALAGTDYSLEEFESQTDGSPLPGMTSCSPISHVDGKQPKTLLAYSEKDSIVSYTNAERIVERLEDTGSEYHLVRFLHSGHDLSDPRDEGSWKELFSKFAEYVYDLTH